jgi:hypothetical protein
LALFDYGLQKSVSHSVIQSVSQLINQSSFVQTEDGKQTGGNSQLLSDTVGRETTPARKKYLQIAKQCHHDNHTSIHAFLDTKTFQGRKSWPSSPGHDYKTCSMFFVGFYVNINKGGTRQEQ